jgi:hypothetical protein
MGLEVTGRSPFELWLNEAVTCHVERKYHAFVAGEEYSRLQEVARIISPMQGTFDEDSGSLAMPIIPEGFNSPDELISNVTYSKAPEFVRMVEQSSAWWSSPRGSIGSTEVLALEWLQMLDKVCMDRRSGYVQEWRGSC